VAKIKLGEVRLRELAAIVSAGGEHGLDISISNSPAFFSHKGKQ